MKPAAFTAVKPVDLYPCFIAAFTFHYSLPAVTMFQRGLTMRADSDFMTLTNNFSVGIDKQLVICYNNHGF